MCDVCVLCVCVCVCVCACVCVLHRAVSSFSLAVKEYVRAGAGHVTPRPDELRPPGVLLETTEYLMTK